MTGTANTAASSADYRADGDLLGEEDDFDALLAASSFGSEQALAIRKQTPAAAREHARRVLDGEEKCAPVEGDIDDAVGGLVYGLAHGVVPGHTTPILDGFDEAEDLVTELKDLISGPAGLKVAIVAACQTSVLWPDHRAHLLQALIDHDALTELRPDVAWNIVNWTFRLDRPPRVLRQCASLAFDQIDVAVLASTRFPAIWGETAERSCQSYLNYFIGRGGPHLPEDSDERKEVIMEAAAPALNFASVHAERATPSTGPAIKVRTDPSSEEPPAAAEVPIRLPANGKRTGSGRPATPLLQPQRERRHMCRISAGITIAALGTPAVVGALLSIGGAASLGGLIAAIASGVAVIGLGVAVVADITLLGGLARSERAFRQWQWIGNRPEPLPEESHAMSHGVFITRRTRRLHNNLCRPDVPPRPAVPYSAIRQHGSNFGQNGRSDGTSSRR